MADNVQFQSTQLATPASGTVVSTDEAASGQVQRVKLAYSANGADTHVTADADGLLVNLGANNDVTVTGTVTATQSGTWNVGVTGSVPLPSGASTEYSLAQLGSNFAAVKSGSNVLVNGIVDARQSGAWNVGINGAVAATQSGSWSVGLTPGNVVSVTDNGGSLTVDNGGTFAVQAAQSGTWNINNIAGTISLPTGAATETSVAAVAATASGSNLRVTETIPNPVRSSAAMVASVAASATNVTLLGSNGSRVGFAVYNDSASVCYLKFGATASSTSFTVLLSAGSYYEYAGHGVYTGQVDAIWATATGSARVTSW